MNVMPADLRRMGRAPDGGYLPAAKPRKQRGTGAKSAAKARKLQNDLEFLKSLEGKWLRRWMVHPGAQEPVRQHRFSPDRKYAFDFCFIAEKVAIEVAGGTWSKTRMGHSTGKGQRRDAEKGLCAAALGWIVLTFTVDMVEQEIGFDEARECLRLRGEHLERNAG